MVVRSMEGNKEQNHAMQRKRRVFSLVVVMDGEVRSSGQGMAKVKHCDDGQGRMGFDS